MGNKEILVGSTKDKVNNYIDEIAKGNKNGAEVKLWISSVLREIIALSIFSGNELPTKEQIEEATSFNLKWLTPLQNNIKQSG